MMNKHEIERLIERLQKHYADAVLKDQYNKHAMPFDCGCAADALRQLAADIDVIENRLKHLLQSKTIALFDEIVFAGTGKCEYARDIALLDKMGICEEIKQAERDGVYDLQFDRAALAAFVPSPDEIKRMAAKCAAPAPDPMPAETREDILRRAAECVSGQREQDHGKPEHNFAMIAQLWSAYRGIEFDAVDVAMMMALLKIARISSGHGCEDSFVDLAGYAACGGEIYAKGGAPIERR